VQDFLQPCIKKKPAQNQFQRPEPKNAAAYPQVSLLKSWKKRGKGGKEKTAIFLFDQLTSNQR
jgi:hypothetical protein